jgi:nitrogen regulatory protein PII
VSTQPAKLLTIVLPMSAEESFLADLRRLGIHGASVATIRGHGAHGDRPSRWNPENVRFDVVVAPTMVDTILAWLEGHYRPTGPVVAWVVDVQAWPPEKFVEGGPESAGPGSRGRIDLSGPGSRRT